MDYKTVYDNADINKIVIWINNSVNDNAYIKFEYNNTHILWCIDRYIDSYSPLHRFYNGMLQMFYKTD